MLNTLPHLRYLRITCFVALASIGFGCCEAGPHVTDSDMAPELIVVTDEDTDLSLSEDDSILDDQQEDTVPEAEESISEDQPQTSLNNRLLITMHLNYTRGADELIRQGANPHNTYRDGRTLLHEAARFGNISNMEWLVSTHWLDIMAQDNTGNTPAHVAAMAGEVNAIAWLAINGADIAAEDNTGRTAWDILNSNYPDRLIRLQAYLTRLQQTEMPQQNSTLPAIPNRSTSSAHLIAGRSTSTNSWSHTRSSSF